jgi:hypothetical protein
MKYVKGVKVVGKVAVVGSIALTGYEAYNDIQNGNYYSAATRATVLGIGLAATAIPVAGWFVAGGIGPADAGSDQTKYFIHSFLISDFWLFLTLEAHFWACF